MEVLLEKTKAVVTEKYESGNEGNKKTITFRKMRTISTLNRRKKNGSSMHDSYTNLELSIRSLIGDIQPVSTEQTLNRVKDQTHYHFMEISDCLDSEAGVKVNHFSIKSSAQLSVFSLDT